MGRPRQIKNNPREKRSFYFAQQQRHHLTQRITSRITQYVCQQQYRLFKRILDEKPFPFKNEQKPKHQFMVDLMNFWPQWHTRIRQIVHLEMASCDKIESCFES